MVSTTRGAATAGVLVLRVVAAVSVVVLTASTMSPEGAAIEYRVCFGLFSSRAFSHFSLVVSVLRWLLAKRAGRETVRGKLGTGSAPQT